MVVDIGPHRFPFRHYVAFGASAKETLAYGCRPHQVAAEIGACFVAGQYEWIGLSRDHWKELCFHYVTNSQKSPKEPRQQQDRCYQRFNGAEGVIKTEG